MKELLIITDMYPHKYNTVSGVFVQKQAEEMAKKYSVTVVSTSYSHRFEVNSRKGGLIDLTQVYYPVLSPYIFGSVISYRFFVLPIIKKAFAESNPDVIHVHDCRHVPELFVLRSWLNTINTKQFVTIHNIRTHPDKIKGKLFIGLYKTKLQHSLEGWTHVFTVNEKLKEWIKPFVDETQITAIGNAVQPTIPINSEVISPLSKTLDPAYFKILSVGNLVKEKGFDILIKAVESLIRKRCKIQLVIVGDGPEKKRIRNMITNLKLSQEIILTGSVNNDIVRNLYPLFDAFVLPSYSETFGIVYLEAMYAGLPVIGIKGQGIDGVVIDGKNGLLANPQDLGDLERKILLLLDYPEQRSKMAAAGNELVKSRFMLSELTATVIQIYER